jgi:predicted Zn-dependent protease
MEAQDPHDVAASSYLSTHPNTNDRIEKLIALAGSPPPHPVKLFSLEEWQDLRSLCRPSVASSPQSSTDTIH